MILSRKHERPTDLGQLPAGFEIGGCRIERLIGAGGMGAVYEATQLSLKRRVAVKVISAGVPITDILRERFQREAEIQAGLQHPHILPVLNAGNEQGRSFIVMPLINGTTLKAVIRSGAADRSTLLRMLADVGDALDTAHAAGLVHRDVKPQNVLIERGVHPYLADFGLSRSHSDHTLTNTGQLLGSVNYISPEAARGERATAASDIYSFACTAYECLVGLVPYPIDNDLAVLQAHIHDDVPQPSAVRPELPEGVDHVLASGMAKAPDERPRSAAALVEDLRAALADHAPSNGGASTLPLTAVTEDESTFVRVPVTPPEPVARSRSRWIAAIAAVVLLAGGAVGWATGRSTTHVADPNPTVKTVKKGPDRAVAARLTLAFGRLDRGVRPLETKLAHAKTPRGQAAVLAKLGDRYTTASAATRADNAPISTALGRVAGDYKRLSTAAKAHHSKTYARERHALASDQKRLTTAISALQGSGYRLQ